MSVLYVYVTIDVIVQAKSGTGKTCVFTIGLLEAVDPSLPAVQVHLQDRRVIEE